METIASLNLTEMSRHEKMKYLKANNVKIAGNMKNVTLDKLLVDLDAFQRGVIEEAPVGLKSVREARKRVPLGTHRKKLSIDHLNIPKDKVARWVNDKPGRINQALAGGYQLVKNTDGEEAGEGNLTTGQMGDSLTAMVGTDEAGQPITAHLMVIDKDLYDEDQEFKARELDKLDEAITQGTVEPGEGQYIPSGGIKYQR